MLIVNADDWGIDVATTDAIADSFAANRITSATAMVFMADSERAAGVALKIGLPVGLHLNLSSPFTGNDVPEPVRQTHAALTGRFDDRNRQWRRWIPDPTLGRAVIERAVRQQLAQFEELYGRPPTHVDGHKHVHVAPGVARTPALNEFAMRRGFSELPGSRSPKALARHIHHRLFLSRHRSTDHFFSIWSLRDELLAAEQPAAVRLASDDVVEVMAHPGATKERTLLMCDAWAEALRHVQLGTYEDIR